MWVQRWVIDPCCALAIALVALGCGAEEPGSSNNASVGSCQAGQTNMCLCQGKPEVQVCQANGTFAPCPCGATAGQGGAAAGAAPMVGGAGGMPGSTATAGMTAPAQGGRGGTGMTSTMGMAGMGPAGRGSSGAGGAGGAMGAAGSGGEVAPGTDEFARERQACVDEINMYRMSIGRMPLVRGTPEQEQCSDMGAKLDGDSGRAHGSAGMCRGLGGQNTCPGYALTFGGGTLEGTLKFCLKQMWDEGEPPQGVQPCIADRTGCFQAHGHWINMQMETYGRVACGFYKMANGRYWMNQNFGR